MTCTTTNNNENSGGIIRLKVRELDGINPKYFKVKGTTKMIKLKARYSEEIGIPLNALAFIFQGKFIQDNDTAMTLKIKDHDKIRVHRTLI